MQRKLHIELTKERSLKRHTSRRLRNLSVRQALASSTAALVSCHQIPQVKESNVPVHHSQTTPLAHQELQMQTKWIEEQYKNYHTDHDNSNNHVLHIPYTWPATNTYMIFSHNANNTDVDKTKEICEPFSRKWRCQLSYTYDHYIATNCILLTFLELLSLVASFIMRLTMGWMTLTFIQNNNGNSSNVPPDLMSS